MGGASPERASSIPPDGSGAPACRALTILLALLGLLILALGAGPASAASRHTTVTGFFGNDGTTGTSWNGRASAWNKAESQFYGIGPEDLRIISIPTPGVFNFVNPPNGATLDGGYVGNSAEADVDNSGGPRDGDVYVSTESRQLRGFDVGGESLPNFPIPFAGNICGVSVDNEGFVWVGNQASESVERFNPANGNLVGAVGVSNTGIPCGIEVDEVSGDLYVHSEDGTIWKYTKASGYTTHVLLAENAGLFTVNATKGVLYYTAPDGYIHAVSTADGEPIETIEALRFISTLLEVNPVNDVIYAFSGNGSYVFELPVSQVPRATTEDPIADSTVKGTVDADGAGAITECFFEWGTSSEYGEPTVPCSPAPPYGANAPVTAVLPGTKEVTYHYRVVAKNANAGGIGRGVDKTITPHFVPFLKTEEATGISRTTAELHASFAGNGEATEYYFEWGTDESYGTKSNGGFVSAGSPAGHKDLEFEATNLTAGTTYHYRIVAKNGAGESKAEDRTFTTLPAARNVITEPATAVTPTSATLNGKFDIDNEGGGATSYYFEYGPTTAYGSRTAVPPGTSVGSAPGTMTVSKTVEVNKGIRYHYRIVVTNDLGTTFGADQEFKTPQEPQIASLTSSEVTATTAKLIATINPNGSETKYHFEYGTTPSYGQVQPIPDEAIGSGEKPVQVSQQLTNLEVGATYHFRVVASNQWGETASGDQTFAFFTANCPNAHVRQESGAAYLPDCRAYELVSPEIAGSVQLFPGQGLGPIVTEFIPHPQPSNTGLATSPSRFAFWGGIGQINGTNPPNITQDLYVSTRTSSGWVTHYPGLAASTSFGSGGTHCSANMALCENYDVEDPLHIAPEDTGSNGPYVFDANQNSVAVGRFPTMIEEVPGGEEFIGRGVASADYSHFAFGTNNVEFAPGGLTTAPGSAYDNDVAANTATIISKLPGGGNIPQDPLGCTNEGGKQRQCQDEFIRIQAVSTDGSNVLMSTWAKHEGEFPNKNEETGVSDTFIRKDVHLYMHTPAANYNITEGPGAGYRAHFVSMNRDGTRVYFTSDEQVTADDTDNSVDLFEWEEASGEVRRLSTGSIGEAGNTDECNVGWVEGCGVQTVDETIDRFQPGEEEFYTPDNFNSQTGEIYFYSPEQLDGGKGLANQRNLYVFRNGAPQFVTTLSAASPAARMNVAPDGAHMAFVTSAEGVTGYENQGTRQMYVYEPEGANGEPNMLCASCVPSGGPPAGSTIAAQNGLFMANDGRAFFATKTALVPFDTNGKIDVYEYTEGRPQLISSGTASTDTWGGGLLIYPSMTVGLEGVSADGTDVYFSTFDTLVPQDRNGEFIKFYDARTGGGFPFQAPAPPCKAADECHGTGSVGPASPQVGTAAPLGKTGNVRSTKCKKGFVKKHGKCVKKKAKKKKKKKRRAHRQHGGRSND
jgi:hypothetical protein